MRITISKRQIYWKSGISKTPCRRQSVSRASSGADFVGWFDLLNFCLLICNYSAAVFKHPTSLLKLPPSSNALRRYKTTGHALRNFGEGRRAFVKVGGEWQQFSINKIFSTKSSLRENKNTRLKNNFLTNSSILFKIRRCINASNSACPSTLEVSTNPIPELRCGNTV
jgi:hypothetical protein